MRRRLHLGHHWKFNSLCTKSSTQPSHTYSISLASEAKSCGKMGGWEGGAAFCTGYPTQADRGDCTPSPDPQISWHTKSPTVTKARNVGAGVSFCLPSSIARRLQRPASIDFLLPDTEDMSRMSYLTIRQRPRWFRTANKERKMCEDHFLLNTLRQDMI